jgi:hypothetical protein
MHRWQSGNGIGPVGPAVASWLSPLRRGLRLVRRDGRSRHRDRASADGLVDDSRGPNDRAGGDYITNSLLRTATVLTTIRVYAKSRPSSLIAGRLRRRPEGGARSWRPGAAERTAVAGGAGPDRPGASVRPWAKSRRGFRWALPGDEAPVPRPKIATWSAERCRPGRNGTRWSRLASATEMPVTRPGAPPPLIRGRQAKETAARARRRRGGVKVRRK